MTAPTGETSSPPATLPNRTPHSLGADVVKCLETAVWAVRLYDVQNQGCQLQLKNLQQNLHDFFRSAGSLHLVIQYKSAHLRDHPDEPVWSWDGGDSSLLHRLFTEGIQELRLDPALEEAELVQFLKVLAADYNSYHFMGEDVPSMLWKANLKHIHHKTLETFDQFDVLDLSEDSEKERYRAYLFAFLAQISLPTATSAGLVEKMEETGETQPARMEQIRLPEMIPSCATPRGRLLFVEAEDLQKIERDLLQDRNHNFLPDVEQAVLETLWVDTSEGHIQVLYPYLLLVAEQYLHERCWNDVAHLMEKVQILANEKYAALEVGRAQVDQWFDQLASEHRLKEMEKQLHEHHASIDVHGLCLFLSKLPSRCLRVLLSITFQLPRGQMRRSLLDVLVQHGKGQEFLFPPLIEQLPEEDLPDLVHVLSRFDPLFSLSHLVQLAQDAGEVVREEALHALAPSSDPSVKALMLQVVRSLESGARVSDKALKTAIRYFVNHRDTALVHELIRFARDRKFEERSAQEQIRFFMILGELGQKLALPFLEEVLNHKDGGGLFQRKDTEAKKLCAVSGLAKIDDPRARELLARELNMATNSAKVRSRCQMALHGKLKEREEGER